MINKGRQEDVLRDFEADLTAAQGTHSQVFSRILEWQDLYEGDQGRNTQARTGTGTASRLGGDMYPQRDIARVVESSLPDICSPFLTGDDIFEVKPKTANRVASAKVMTKLLNQQFNSSTNKIEFVETLGRTVQVDGSSFVKVGWADDEPALENVQVSEVFIDPSAQRLNDARFIIHRSKVPVADIRSNTAWYGEHSEEVLSRLEAATESQYDDQRNQGFGHDNSFNYDDRSRQLVEVFTYYGMYDLHGDGTLIPVLGIWADNTILRMTESPFPESWNGSPFEVCVYNRVPYSVYGSGVAEMLRSSQMFRQSITTAIGQNMANSTAGQKFFQKGAMDQINFRRMVAGERHIYMNKPPSESFAEGTFTDLPSSVFAVNDMLKAEQDELSGISNMSQGLDPRALNSGTSATAVSITNTNSQKRLLQIVRHISEMLERVGVKMIQLNQMMLQESTIMDGDEEIPLNGGMLGGVYGVDVVAGTAGAKQSKIQNLQMMLSMTAGKVSPAVSNQMLSDLAQLLEMPALAAVIQQESQQEPDPMQQQIQQAGMQLEFQEKQAGIAKDQAKAKLDNAKAMETFVDTERASYGLN